MGAWLSGTMGEMSTGHEFKSPAAVAPRSRRTSSLAILAVLVILILVSIVWFQRRSRSQSINPVRLSLGMPSGLTLHRNWHPFEHIALSPNGQMLAFAATDASGQTSLWIKSL